LEILGLYFVAKNMFCIHKYSLRITQDSLLQICFFCFAFAQRRKESLPESADWHEHVTISLQTSLVDISTSVRLFTNAILCKQDVNISLYLSPLPVMLASTSIRLNSGHT
jgi:hypothetical protein